jgi:hypothetical protein
MKILTFLKNKFIKLNKILVIVFCIIIGIIIGFVSDKLSNEKISNFITLSMMYFQNPKEIKFSGMSIIVPFRYTRVQDKDNLTLLCFPKGRGVIFFNNEYLSKERFDNEFKKAQHEMHYELISEGEIIIDNEKGYFFTGSKKTNPSEYKEYLTIPTRNITASFLGDKKYSLNFWKIVKQIHFITEGE